MPSYSSIIKLLITLSTLTAVAAVGQSGNPACQGPAPKTRPEIRAALSQLDPKTQSEDEKNCAVKLLDKLDRPGEPESIPTLIRFIGFKRPLGDDEKGGFPAHPRVPAYNYPAIGVLIQIGEAAWNPLIDFIESSDLPALEMHNAVFAMVETHSEPERAISALVKARNSGTGGQPARIEGAIDFALSTSFCKLREGRCEAALTNPQ